MDKTEKIILNEGFNSVIRNGIRSFTVERLASSLSMSKKTIYSFFPKKEVLIKKIIDFRMKKLSLEFREIINNHDDAIIQFIEVRNHHIKSLSRTDEMVVVTFRTHKIILFNYFFFSWNTMTANIF